LRAQGIGLARKGPSVVPKSRKKVPFHFPDSESNRIDNIAGQSRLLHESEPALPNSRSGIFLRWRSCFFLLNRPGLGGVPEQDGGISEARGQGLAIGREGQGGGEAVVAREAGDFSGFEVDDVDRPPLPCQPPPATWRSCNRRRQTPQTIGP